MHPGSAKGWHKHYWSAGRREGMRWRLLSKAAASLGETHVSNLIHTHLLDKDCSMVYVTLLLQLAWDNEQLSLRQAGHS